MAEPPKERFEEILQLVWSHLIAANVHLTIWEELRSTSEREKLCNTYYGFFYWTRDAHVDRFIHKICVVVDRDKGQPSLYKLISMIQAHPSLAPGLDFRNLLTCLKAQEDIQTEIREVRDVRSSHWDLKKTPPEPKIAECRALLKELSSILEDIWNANKPNACGRDYYSLTPTGHSHTAEVLNKLTSTMYGGQAADHQ